MKINKILKVLSLLLITLSMLTACSRNAAAYVRPAIGPTVKEQSTCKLDVSSQSSLNIMAQDGNISIRQWNSDFIQITCNKSIKGPSTKEKLKEMLDGFELRNDNSSSYNINVNLVPEDDLKPLYRRTENIDIFVPDNIKQISIDAESGNIELFELENLNGLDISLDRGSTAVSDCSSRKTTLNVSTGNITVNGLKGTNNSVECGKGNMKLVNIEGTTEVNLISGSIAVEKLNGKFDGIISTGDIVISDSSIKTESSIYTSYGNITADLSGIEDTGTYSIDAANGNIKLKLPDNKGWSIIAEADKGHIDNNVKAAEGSLKISPTGELYGDVAGGGANVDAYVYNGSIYLN